MLRLDPGEGRVRTARQFQAWEGGGEYNVARGLRRCFGLRTAVVTAFADNEVGRLLEDLILQGGVDTVAHPLGAVRRHRPHRPQRTELHRARASACAARSACSDRGHTAASQLRAGRRRLGAPVRHARACAGSTPAASSPALSETTPDVIEAAMAAAHRHGTVVSYDLNYRPSLWKAIGGQARAQEVNRRLARYVDVMIGNEEDFTACLGFEVPDTDEPTSTSLEAANFQRMIDEVTKEYPNFAVVATTLRTVRSATVNDWGAIAWSPATGVRRGDAPAGPGDPRPGRRRRQLRVRPDLRAHVPGRPGRRRRVRRRARRAGDDHAGRHVDGEPGRGGAARAGCRGPRPTLSRPPRWVFRTDVSGRD